jgi:hypothetical protein
MTHRLAIAAALGFTFLVAGGVSGCSSYVQAGPVAAAPAQALQVAYIAMPAPRAPFDETPITPMETVGASRAN